MFSKNIFSTPCHFLIIKFDIGVFRGGESPAAAPLQEPEGEAAEAAPTQRAARPGQGEGGDQQEEECQGGGQGPYHVIYGM